MSTNLMTAHREWANRPADERYETIESLRQAVHSRRTRSRSVDVDMSRIKVAAAGDVLQINGTITPCEPSHWSFGQLATNVGAPASYLRTLPLPLVMENLRHGLEKNSAGAVKFMTVASEDSEVNKLQAVTSTTYGRIWDADCVDAVIRINERTGGKFYNPRAYAHRLSVTPGGFTTLDTSKTVGSGLYASDRDVFMFMIDGGSLLDAGPRAKLNRGFIMSNSEVGARVWRLKTFLHNRVCGNHIIWDAQDVKEITIRHTSGGPTRFDYEATPALLEFANASAKPLEDQIRRASDYLLPQATAGVFHADDVQLFAQRNGKFSRGEVANAINFAKSEEGECRTLWQLVQGGTAYARGFDHIDSRVDLETRFGKLLDIVKN